MKVFKMNDYDWWMAPTLAEAEADALRIYESPEHIENARELTAEELDTLEFHEDMGNENAPIRTFRKELERRIALGCGTEMFASAEF